jgi:hypothetical protein
MASSARSAAVTASPRAQDHRTPKPLVVGDQDQAHASAGALAAVLPSARFTRVPGDHWSTLTGPELATAITAFLPGRPREPKP